MAKMRSPNYPALGLGEALARVRSLWAKEKRTPVDAEVAANAIGYSGINGPSRTALSSMKKYGLVESDDKTIRVSDLALQIIHPASEEAGVVALREAAMTPDLFRQLFETHRDASDGALRSYLITKLGFSEIGARHLIKAYRDTLMAASLDKPEYLPNSMTVKEDKIQTTETIVDDVKSVRGFVANERILPSWYGDNHENNTQQTFSWPLAPGVIAEVRIVGGEAKPQHLRAIRSYLELAEKLMQEHEHGNEVTRGLGTEETIA